MTDHDDRFLDVLSQEYRPDPQSHDHVDRFKRSVKRRVRLSILVRVSACLVLIGVLGTASWQTWFGHGAETTAPALTVNQSPSSQSEQVAADTGNWADTLQTAWLEIDDLVSFDDTILIEEDSDTMGVQLPDSMIVVAGIVELTDGKDAYP